jgi:glycosyltransferase involved in cell wall biosynthesis
MKSKIITTIPVYNGEAFIEQTLNSIANQTLRPDRVVVLDNCSTDRTEEIVRNFKGIRCEYIRNPSNLGSAANHNRCLDFADQTDYLQILHADDMIKPEFYAAMTELLADCDGLGLAWCLDERIDEANRRLSISGKADAKVERLDRDTFLKRKAEIGNQAYCATLMKTAGRPLPCRFLPEFPMLGDMVFWADLGFHCRQTVHLHRVLGQYRWHGSNASGSQALNLQSFLLDEWRGMERIEALRGKGWSAFRKLKLLGLFSVRSNIKAKRLGQNGAAAYSREVARVARQITGWPLWLAGRVLVELRDIYLFTILGRTRHPKNIYG